MRPTRMATSLVAAVATVLALAPAGASAARLPHIRIPRQAVGIARCHLSMYVEPHVVTTGESAQVFGQLFCGKRSNINTEKQTVTVYEHTVGSATHVLGTTETGAAGYYSLPAPALTANTAFYATALTGHSGIRVARVSPTVSFNGPEEKTTLYTGFHNEVSFTGAVNPADEGATIVLQRENATSNEDWHAIQRGIVGAGGSYTFVHRFVVPGDANLRVVVRPHNGITVRGISSTRSYQISQAQRPNLKIESTVDPLAFGETSSIHGVLVNGANQAVTLLAHNPGVAGFTTVGTTMTDGSGNYAFTVAPQQNTFYEVKSATTGSAVLFEGVKYILTASASGTTVQAGQTLMFTGTVTPNRQVGGLGHVVYLERENLFGGGYHVVDVTRVQADGTYTFNHAFFGASKQKLRVKVPGDPDNQGVSSAPFTVEVTSAPGQPIHPRPQAPQPSEGQL